MAEGAAEGQSKSLPEAAQQQNKQEPGQGVGRRQLLKGVGAAAGLLATLGRKAFGGEAKGFDTKDLDKAESANQAVMEFTKHNSQLRQDISVEVSKGEISNIPLGEGFNEKTGKLTKELQELRGTFGDSPYRTALDSKLTSFQQVLEQATKETEFQKKHAAEFGERRKVLKSLDELRQKKQTNMLTGKEWELHDELVLKDNKLREQIQSIREAGRNTNKEERTIDQPKQPADESNNPKLQEVREKIKRVEDAAKSLNKPLYKPEQK
jgi:hypothetical protein